VKRGLTGGDLTMKMQGGELNIQIDKEWNIRMTGEVREIVRGILSKELLPDLQLPL
jgi:diaminopimelate epimerase